MHGSCRRGLFVAACLGELVTANMSFALISPFFPLYAPTVGLQLADISLIFGAMAFAQLVASPLAGPTITAAGRRTTLCIGTTLLSVSGTAFGVVPPLLDRGSAALTGVAAPWVRETLVGLRLVQGVGAALTTTCVFAVLADAFPGSVGKVMGAAELAAGLGWTVAPPLGGLLYAAGGYSFPFTIFGPMPLCFVLVVLALYPADVIAAADANLSADPTASIESLPPAYRRVWALRSTGLFVTALLTCFPYAIWSCFDVGFTVWFVGEFEYSVLTATMFFTIAPATYTPWLAVIGTVPAGWATDKFTKNIDGSVIPGAKKRLLALGQGLSGAFYLGYGSWWMPSDSSHVARATVLFVLQLLLGLANPLFMVPALPDMHECHGGRPSEDTTNLISAIYTTMMNIGGVVGPAVANAAIPTLGFRNMVAAVGAFFMLSSLAVLLYVRQQPTGADTSDVADNAERSMYSVLTNDDEDEVKGAGTSDAERVGLLSVAKARDKARREAIHRAADAVAQARQSEWEEAAAATIAK